MSDDSFFPKSFTFESLVKSGSKKIQLAQMTEDDDGITLKKFQASSVDFSKKSPYSSKNSTTFSFSRSKSTDVNNHNNEHGNDQDILTESTNDIQDYTTSRNSNSFNNFTNSIASNISKIGFSSRKDNSYSRVQQSSNLLSDESLAST